MSVLFPFLQPQKFQVERLNNEFQDCIKRYDAAQKVSHHRNLHVCCLRVMKFTLSRLKVDDLLVSLI